MSLFVSVYNLRDDVRRIKMIQESSIDMDLKTGYMTEKNLLFGTKEWFNAVEQGLVPKHIKRGKITRVYESGHNDFPEFEMENIEGKSTWMRLGDAGAYEIGKEIELVYVEQKYKRPIGTIGQIAKCVIEIKISG